MTCLCPICWNEIGRGEFCPKCGSDLRGVGGYGSTSRYHTDKILRLSQDLPIVIEAVECNERIEKILPRLDEMVGGGLITLEKVHVILYRSSRK